jgi:hypothetical protein
VEEAVWLCARELGCWVDADGACDWVAGRLPEGAEEAEPKDGDPSDRDYIDLYYAVMERAKEIAEDEPDGGSE